MCRIYCAFRCCVRLCVCRAYVCCYIFLFVSFVRSFFAFTSTIASPLHICILFLSRNITDGRRNRKSRRKKRRSAIFIVNIKSCERKKNQHRAEKRMRFAFYSIFFLSQVKIEFYSCRSTASSINAIRERTLNYSICLFVFVPLFPRISFEYGIGCVPCVRSAIIAFNF